MQRVAGAKAIPDARRADGAPQQARTSPRPQAGEGSRRCPMRHAADGVQPNSGDKFRVPAQRGVRGCRGCRGDFPLSPHAPRRAGDPPPAPGSSRDAQSDIGSLRPERFTFFKVELLQSIFSLKRFAFQTIRPLASRKKRSFSTHFGPGGAVPRRSSRGG